MQTIHHCNRQAILQIALSPRKPLGHVVCFESHGITLARRRYRRNRGRLEICCSSSWTCFPSCSCWKLLRPTQGVGPVAAACLRKLVCSGPIRVGRDGGLICAGCTLSEPPCASSAFTVRQAIKSPPSFTSGSCAMANLVDEG